MFGPTVLFPRNFYPGDTLSVHDTTTLEGSLRIAYTYLALELICGVYPQSAQA